MKEIKNLIGNQTFLMEELGKVDPVNPCMDVYKTKIQYIGSIEELNLRIVVRGDLKNKEIIGDTWYPIASMSTLKYFLAYSSKQK